MLDDSPLIVTSVSFGDTHMEIGFIEKKDQTPDAGLMKNLVVSNANYQAEFAQLMETLEDIIDAGLLEIRNPPESLDPRQRVGKRKAVAVTTEAPDE